jgi:hypothetical protein
VENGGSGILLLSLGSLVVKKKGRENSTLIAGAMEDFLFVYFYGKQN